jgi:low molecular weight protein-tyrosine phosphatase
MAGVGAVKAARPTTRRVTGGVRRQSAPIGFFQRIYRATRALNDRFLHPGRHLTVRRRLLSMPRPRRILVVCDGNLCRSPYLEAVLQRHLPDIAVTSAGFVGSDRAVPKISVALSAQRGFQLERYRSRPITQSKVQDADLVIVMDAQQARRIARMFRVERDRIVIAGDLEPTFDTSRAIRDPWNKSAETFQATFDRLDRCAATLVSLL